MDLKDKIVGLALAALIALVGWNLKETWNMKEQVFKLQQGQVFLSKEFNPPENFHNSEFFLTVLEPNLTEIDYKAVMSSKDRLRQV